MSRLKIRMPTAETTPPLLQLAIERGATNPPGKSMLHGENHWKAVAITGLHLARWTAGASLQFIFSFAVIHDVCRQNDDADLEHGIRAAALFESLIRHPGIADHPRKAEATQDLIYAIEYHTTTRDAREHVNPNVGLCWDADRLNLWRVGIEPDNRFLTTSAARTFGAKQLGWELCERQLNYKPFPTWDEIKKEMDECRFP